VVGGALPAAVAADWLTSAWDQNGGGAITAPALAVVEAIAAEWVRELLGLPAGCGVGFVTGCQMAHVTCLAAARHAVLADAGWNVEADGLQGAPALRVVAGANAHVTIARACRILGLGADTVRIVPADAAGRMLAGELAVALGEHDGPQIVCAQAGEVNTGAFDPLEQIVDLCRARGAWCHVDGAFGLWAALSPSRRHLLQGFEGADSWATDGHKWLNVPYDCGIALVADATRQRGAMASTADYIPANDSDVPWGVESTPEFSRRARAVPLYAALRSLGRDGVRDLVERCCDHAQRIAARLAEHGRVQILNEVVLNQVLVRFGRSDELTDQVIARVQRDGICWAGGSRWHGGVVMRISVSGWQTTAADADRSADAILAALRAVLATTA
jgi:glutamate/tyrosine decarboxylase-like PLP-dependent enzyme